MQTNNTLVVIREFSIGYASMMFKVFLNGEYIKSFSNENDALELAKNIVQTYEEKKIIKTFNF